jgi:chromosome segregation ATPase
MDKWFKIISDIIVKYPDGAALYIVVVSSSFAALLLYLAYMAKMYKATTDGRISHLQEVISNTKPPNELTVKIKELSETLYQQTLDMKNLHREIEDLKQRNSDGETDLKLTRMQARLQGMITSTQNRIGAVREAVDTQDARQDIFRKSRQKQRRNWFNRIFK